MDPEKFEQQLMSYLFDEVDELTRAAVKRHLDASAEARELEARLRATIEATRAPLEEPPGSLEQRILEAVETAELGEPWHRKVLRLLSWAGSHAMRPQFAMGALMVMLLGSSLLLLRARPGAMQVSTTRDAVTEKDATPTPGAGAGEPAPVTPAPMPPSAAAVESAKLDDEPAEALLERARRAREDSGCKAAVPVYARLRERFGASGFGADATFEEATCELELANRERAEDLASTLKDHPEYRRKAASMLETKGASKVASKAAKPSASGGSPARGAAASAPDTRSGAPSKRASSAPAAGGAPTTRE